MPSHVRQEITSVPKTLLTLCAGKFAVVRDTRSPTPTGGHRCGSDSLHAQGGVVVGIIDDVQGVSSAQETRSLHGGVKAGVTPVGGHDGLSKVGEIIQGQVYCRVPGIDQGRGLEQVQGLVQHQVLFVITVEHEDRIGLLEQGIGVGLTDRRHRV